MAVSQLPSFPAAPSAPGVSNRVWPVGLFASAEQSATALPGDKSRTRGGLLEGRAAWTWRGNGAPVHVATPFLPEHSFSQWKVSPGNLPCRRRRHKHRPGEGSSRWAGEHLNCIPAQRALQPPAAAQTPAHRVGLLSVGGLVRAGDTAKQALQGNPGRTLSLLKVKTRRLKC